MNVSKTQTMSPRRKQTKYKKKSPRRTILIMPQPLPERIRRRYERKKSENYSEQQKQIHEKKELELKDKVVIESESGVTKLEVKQINEHSSPVELRPNVEVTRRKLTKCEIKSTRRTILIMPQPLPKRIKRIYEKKNSENYSEQQKQIHEKNKLELKDKVVIESESGVTTLEVKQINKNSSPGELRPNVEATRRKLTKCETKSPRGTILIMPQPLPKQIRRSYEKKNTENYSEQEKRIRQEKKRELKGKVGWEPRKGMHRHKHQAIREQQLLNYMNGLPLDYGCDSD